MDDETKYTRFVPKKIRNITSYGLILYNDTGDDDVKYLLHQRRDTYEYNDFIKGLWTDQGQLSIMFQLMSEDERERIRNYIFPELWSDLFIDHNNNHYRETYSYAYSKYKRIVDHIPNLLDTTKTNVKGPPWGFPKGRKTHDKEGNIDCAIRETIEETRLNVNDILCDNRLGGYPEWFYGTDQKSYSTTYFVAKVRTLALPSRINLTNIIRPTTLSDESEDVKWFTCDEACNLLNTRRQNILREIHKKITGK